MWPFQGPTIIPMQQRIILAGEITQISYGAKTTMTTQGQTTSIIPIIISILPIIFLIIITILQLSTKLSQPCSTIFFSNPLIEKRMTDFEKTMERYMRNQESLVQILQNNNAQAITRLEVQIGQLDNSQNERPKGTLPSQPLTNP